MNSFAAVVGGRPPFTATQWQELEHQALILKYLMAGVPVPPELIIPIRRSFEALPGRYYHPSRKRPAPKPSPSPFVLLERSLRPLLPILLLPVVSSRNFYDSGLYFSGLKPDADEHSFFSEASGTARALGVDSSLVSSWRQMPPPVSSFSLSKTHDLSILQNAYPQLQSVQDLGQVTINSLSRQQQQHHSFFGSEFGSSEPVKHETQLLRPFFDEWPKTRDSWSDLEEERSNRTSFSTTQLSISIPIASSDFSSTSSRSPNGRDKRRHWSATLARDPPHLVNVTHQKNLYGDPDLSALRLDPTSGSHTKRPSARQVSTARNPGTGKTSPAAPAQGSLAPPEAWLDDVVIAGWWRTLSSVRLLGAPDRGEVTCRRGIMWAVGS
ncbi:hypothetical protein BHE74_00006388 [Ensete ventricosum]|nr:hypothetical protein BHE74_00006388 [Ensete ventricosum]